MQDGPQSSGYHKIYMQQQLFYGHYTLCTRMNYIFQCNVASLLPLCSLSYTGISAAKKSKTFELHIV